MVFKRLGYAYVLVSALVLCGTSHITYGEEGTKNTLDNVQTAYQGESNAKVRYAAYALKADEEGYRSVAALFRAAAKSEEIHARNLAVIVKKLGQEPKADPAKPEVRSTKENLEAALKGETQERDTMYPAFIKKAIEENNTDAVRSFHAAMAAETEHAKSYKDALENLDKWKEPGKAFLVCEVCGYTSADTKLRQCPVCFAPRSKIVLVK